MGERVTSPTDPISRLQEEHFRDPFVKRQEVDTVCFLQVSQMVQVRA